MIGRLKQTREGTALQFPGWIIRRAQRRFEKNGMKGQAWPNEHTSMWKLPSREIIARLKSTKEGTEGNNGCWKN